MVTAIREFLPDSHILVIDDNSPDGTGEWCDRQAAEDDRFAVLHREGKLGLGSATYAGLTHAIENQFTYVATLDADFSHPPRYLPSLVEAVESGAAEVAIGSRYVKGGGVDGWPLKRRIMSRFINWYTRALLTLPVRDCSGAFRCYRVAKLAELDFTKMVSQGYSYVEELLVRLKWKGATFTERPFIFVDRERGSTKINLREAVLAVAIIFRLGLANWFGWKY